MGWGGGLKGGTPEGRCGWRQWTEQQHQHHFTPSRPEQGAPVWTDLGKEGSRHVSVVQGRVAAVSLAGAAAASRQDCSGDGQQRVCTASAERLGQCPGRRDEWSRGDTHRGVCAAVLQRPGRKSGCKQSSRLSPSAPISSFTEPEASRRQGWPSEHDATPPAAPGRLPAAEPSWPGAGTGEPAGSQYVCCGSWVRRGWPWQPAWALAAVSAAGAWSNAGPPLACLQGGAQHPGCQLRHSGRGTGQPHSAGCCLP